VVVTNRKYQAWVELNNPFSSDATLSDNGAAKLEMPANGMANPAYGIYQVVLSKPDTANLQAVTNTAGDPTAGNVLSTLSAFSNGMLAAPAIPYPSYTKATLPATPDTRFILPANGDSSGVAGNNYGYYLLGPLTVPTPAGSAGWPNSTYQRDEMSFSTLLTDPLVNPTILVRRLACPLLPPQTNPALPLFNPYITVDYLENVAAQDSTAAVATRVSQGRNQPYAADASQKANQAPNPALVGQPQHTLFNANTPLTSPFTWLVHLDRQLISPMELLHVSAYKPHLLTQQFYNVNGVFAAGGAVQSFQHYAPWFDQGVAAGNSARLYRLFEFLETRNRTTNMRPIQLSGQTAVTAAGAVQVTVGSTSGTDNTGAPWSINVGDILIVDTAPNQENVRVTAVDATTFTANFQKPHGAPFQVLTTTMGSRLAGKININTIWDIETFRALCDAQTPNGFSGVGGDVDTIYSLMLASRTPGANNVPGATDKPFWSLAAGLTSPGDTQYPGGLSIENTLLRSQSGGGGGTPRLFEITTLAAPNNHPYRRMELLTKIYNNLTTRSNVFAVWVTVGFFEVVDDTTLPVKLGAEIGRSVNKQIRHRMFAIVDRTAVNPLLFSTTSGTAVAGGGAAATVTPAAMTATDNFGNVWSIQVGDSLLVDTGANQEIVQVTAVTSSTFTANFNLAHAANVGITKLWGPQMRLNPHQLPGLIPYFSIID
jgi:hypothetical protein